MTAYFLDTSALAKRYTREPGSKWIKSLTKPKAGNVIVIAEIAAVEMFSLLARRVHEGDITAASSQRLREVFWEHVRQEYKFIRVSTPQFLRAQRLVTKYGASGLRALDAIQLACAIDAQAALKTSITFLCADGKLLTAAQAEGFVSDNPNQHL